MDGVIIDGIIDVSDFQRAVICLLSFQTCLNKCRWVNQESEARVSAGSCNLSVVSGEEEAGLWKLLRNIEPVR